MAEHIDDIKQEEVSGVQGNAEANPDARKGSDHGPQGQAVVHPGSTTQGGSNFGQGSSQLGNLAYKQGNAKNEGSTYENEQGFHTESK